MAVGVGVVDELNNIGFPINKRRGLRVLGVKVNFPFRQTVPRTASWDLAALHFLRHPPVPVFCCCRDS